MDQHTMDPSIERPPNNATPTGWDEDTDRWEHETLRRAVIHGIRLYNSGEYHDAHDVFEDEWKKYGQGKQEKAFLQGLVQLAAGVYKLASHDNETGLIKLFRTSRGYLSDVPLDYYGVNVSQVHEILEKGIEQPESAIGTQVELDTNAPAARQEDLEYAESIELV
ncbi:DUF309 domain-containing protein [Halanaeroarchaeum sulfurireducens]|uniref:DUF309 domain-containing protein n=1 Tax=Halanaeroarchaeum sulfurireducens TaxID=1604004 RepID=A0A0F7P9Q1_9EURY|nr:DUF309 domain-containing protein [Halanaeroarchaeum sulfurireducens]AKH97866.1 hypothetical protein HLASF_1381 [Halanaeroarchaeum sulfurireducens]ALG82260.1 hypothetical protein HLASA_1368 [Halanaeroarchaeum sulfurireducens]